MAQGVPEDFLLFAAIDHCVGFDLDGLQAVAATFLHAFVFAVFVQECNPGFRGLSRKSQSCVAGVKGSREWTTNMGKVKARQS